MSSETLLNLVLLGLVCLMALGWWGSSRRASVASKGRNARARAGEDDAGAVLRAWGYEPVEQQVTGRWELLVDGEVRSVHCRADYLVRAGGQLFVADVKTGSRAPDPALPATRRQLLEYRLVFDVAGVVVVDMETRQVRTVEFPWV